MKVFDWVMDEALPIVIWVTIAIVAIRASVPTLDNG